MFKGARTITLLFSFLVPLLIQGKEGEVIMGDVPKAAREFRGVWVATVANIDWPSRPGLTSAQQKTELIAILDKAVELNLNAIILQVRPMCDALYASKYEPWSYFLSGEMGKAPEPYYDPLEFAVEEAHKRALELHAWFNPYRALHPTSKPPVSSNHISKTHPELVRQYGKFLWLDPGEKSVLEHSIGVILDVVQRYDIDGVHIDDYFYPYPEKDKEGKLIDFPDEPSWKKYKDAGGKLSRDDWRRDNVNRFVVRYYQGVKALKPWVKVGISPFGIWRPGYPAVVAGLDQFQEIFADAKLWLEKGWVDYFTPQLYWKISAPKQPYKELLKWWVEQNKQGRHIWPGNFTSKVLRGEGQSWPAEEIINQIQATREQKGASGNVHFSMKALLKNGDNINTLLKTGVYSEPALIPASPWLDNNAPDFPKVAMQKEETGDIILNINLPADDVWQLACYSKKNQKWSLNKIYSARKNTQVALKISRLELPDEIALSILDRCGNESPHTLLYLQPSQKAK